MPAHKDIIAEDRHSPFNYIYADSTARLAATGFTPDDVYKVALQLSNATLWTLTDDDPITWLQTGGAYVDENAQDAIGSMVIDSDTIDFTYTDPTPEFKADVRKQMSITSDSSGIKLVGDSASPGNNQVYGTDGSGNKGWKADPSGGGGGITWTQVINESGASFANFTSGAGTWSSDGTVIKNTDTATNRKARFNTSIFGGILAFEAEIQIRTSGVDRCGGLLLGYDGSTGNNGMLVRINEGNNNINVENDSIVGVVNFSATIDINTWYKLRVNVVGDNVEIYLDGVKKGAGRAGNFTNTTYIGLYSTNAEVWFKNIKAWTPDLDWPA